MRIKFPKNPVKFLIKNYIVLAIGVVVVFVGLVAVSKLFLSKPHFVYVKVKVGQGFWWANTQRPSIWQIDSMNKGDKVEGISGGVQAEILSKRYYRFKASDEFDIYLTLRLDAQYSKKTDTYTFDRSTLSVGAPIEFQFPRQEITGTVIDMSEQPFDDKLVERIVTLSKRGALPWEYEGIQVGSAYFDGEENVFEIVEKSSRELTNLTSDSFGNTTPAITEPSKYITIKAKVKVREVGNLLILGEDQTIVAGKILNISTPTVILDGYIIGKVE